MKNIIVLYHANCPDGFGAAWAAWKKFKNKADYIAVSPHLLPQKSIKNKEVYILDTIYPAKILKELKAKNKSITVLDHHISNKSDIKSADNWVFDLNHSGAVLAWQYFHPKKAVPRLLQHIEDYDLWHFKLPFTKEIFIVLELLDFDFRDWSKFAAKLEKVNSRKKIITEGKVILKYQKSLVRKIVKDATLVRFAGYKMFAVNSPVLGSEIGNALVKKLPPLSLVWRVKNGKIGCSLRSNGKVDVAKIAKRFGGGGHRAAAGFVLPRDVKLPWKILNSI